MSNNMVHYKEGQCSFVRWILKRKRQNNNTLILCYGQTGSGKTYATIRKAWELDNTLDVRQIVFSFTEMMEVVNADWFKEKKIKQIIYEEAQVSMNSRTWQSMINRIINHLLSTFRATQVIVWFTTPYKDFLDSQSMKLIHCTLETKGINRATNKCRVKISLEEYNSSMQKYYHHSLLVKKNHVYNKLKEILVSLPPKDLLDKYEEKKKAFNDMTNADILAKARAIENKDKPKENPNIKPIGTLSLFQTQIVECWKRGIGKQKDIAKELGCVDSKITQNIQAMLRKGYYLGNFFKFQEKQQVRAQ